MKLTLIGHDYAEFKIGNKRYSINLYNDKHDNPIGWQKEIGQIRKTNINTIRKKYKIESTTYNIPPPHPLLKGFYKEGR